MRLKESLALLLLITVSGVFGQDNDDPKSSTPAPTSTPAPVKCKTRDPVSPAPKEPEISDVFEMIAEVTQVVSYCLIIESNRRYSLGIKVDCIC